MSIHVEMTNPVLTRVSRDDQSGELVLEFRHHSDTLLLVWHVEGTRNRAVAKQELNRIANIGTGILTGSKGGQWEAQKPPSRRRRPSRALDRAGLTESGPRPITGKV